MEKLPRLVKNPDDMPEGESEAAKEYRRIPVGSYSSDGFISGVQTGESTRVGREASFAKEAQKCCQWAGTWSTRSCQRSKAVDSRNGELQRVASGIDSAAGTGRKWCNHAPLGRMPTAWEMAKRQSARADGSAT